MRKHVRNCGKLALITVLVASFLTACGYDNDSLDVTKLDVDSYIGEIGDYSNLTVEVTDKQQINDNTVQEYIDYVMSAVGQQYEEVNRAIVSGDQANIDYEGYKDGVQFESGTAAGYDLVIGSGTFIPGFEDGLVGYSAGDEVELNLTFPENYGNADLAGADVVFKVKVNAVKEPVETVITDEMVGLFGIEGVATEEQFRAYIKSNMELAASNEYDNSLRDATLQALHDSTEFKSELVPNNLLNYYMTQVQSNDQSMASQYGVSLQEFVENYYGTTYDEYVANCKAQAIVMVQDVMLCEKIARTKGIKITDADLEAQMAVDAANYGYESVEQFKAAMDENDYKNYMIELKVIDMILETATVNVVDNPLNTVSE